MALGKDSSKSSKPKSLTPARQNMWGVWLLSIGTFVLTVFVVLGLFWSGRWVWRKTVEKPASQTAQKPISTGSTAQNTQNKAAPNSQSSKGSSGSSSGSTSNNSNTSNGSSSSSNNSSKPSSGSSSSPNAGGTSSTGSAGNAGGTGQTSGGTLINTGPTSDD